MTNPNNSEIEPVNEKLNLSDLTMEQNFELIRMCADMLEKENNELKSEVKRLSEARDRFENLAHLAYSIIDQQGTSWVESVDCIKRSEKWKSFYFRAIDKDESALTKSKEATGI